jgi:hypothetical protein
MTDGPGERRLGFGRGNCKTGIRTEMSSALEKNRRLFLQSDLKPLAADVHQSRMARCCRLLGMADQDPDARRDRGLASIDLGHDFATQDLMPGKVPRAVRGLDARGRGDWRASRPWRQQEGQ